MVYLEHSSTSFWRCENKSKTKISIQYGKCGRPGRTLIKEFETASKATYYIDERALTKRKIGYIDAKDPQRCKKHKMSAVTTIKSKKIGLANHLPPSTNTNIVNGLNIAPDSGLAKFNTHLASKAKVHPSFHAKLVLVNPETNSDKYYILQIIIDEKSKKTKLFFLYTRWGRTGTCGQAKLDGPFKDTNVVTKKFAATFESKTGSEWSKAYPGMPTNNGKYEYLYTNTNTNGKKEGKWFYFLTNDPMDKTDGWYSYDNENSDEMEQLYNEFVSSNNSARLSTRFIHSETSGFTYQVDLLSYSQRNTYSGMQRPIMRCIDSKPPQTPPTHMP